MRLKETVMKEVSESGVDTATLGTSTKIEIEKTVPEA